MISYLLVVIYCSSFSYSEIHFTSDSYFETPDEPLRKVRLNEFKINYNDSNTSEYLKSKIRRETRSQFANRPFEIRFNTRSPSRRPRKKTLQNNNQRLPSSSPGCPESFKCVPLIHCSFSLNDTIGHTCDNGICCPENGVYPIKRDLNIVPPSDLASRKFVVIVKITRPKRNVLDTAIEAGLRWIKNILRIEDNLNSRGLILRNGTKERFHQDFFGTSLRTLQITRNAMLLHRSALEIAKRLQFTRPEDVLNLNGINLRNTRINNTCPLKPKCPSTKYRTIDGSCNNLNNRNWGKSMTPFNRLIPPEYADGFDEPRVARSGSQLPNPRLISQVINFDVNIPDEIHTLLLMVLGQFLDHDLTLTASTRMANNEGILCCDEQFIRDPSLLHPACFPIFVPRNDFFVTRFGTSCLNFVRSAPAIRDDCEIGPREQLDQLTAYIDAGMIYGSSKEKLNKLRNGAKLRISNINGKHFLPRSDDRSCTCFEAGDNRVNEQLALALMHTIWVREHNRIVDELSAINPGWNHRILFEETKRIVNAELQHIIYNEFLLVILGREVSDLFGLSPLHTGHTNYDPFENPSILSSFSTAAYRFHTLIQGVFELRNEFNNIINQVDLSHTFNNPDILIENNAIDLLIYGLSGQRSQKADRHFSEEITNKLFRQRNEPIGMDLVALNIQRGRDHGLPGYNKFREICGLRKINNFNELDSIFEANSEELEQLYETVDDIDLFVAGNLEKKLPGSLVGPTFACLIGEQFKRLKYGDRFFYEHGNLESSFTDEQLQEIRKSNLARILCDNGDNIKVMQQLALILPFDWNPKVSCDSPMIPRLDLSHWRNEPVWS